MYIIYKALASDMKESQELVQKLERERERKRESERERGRERERVPFT